jgi:hypothetical protein
MLSLARAIVERKHDSCPRAAMAHYSAPAQKLKEAVSISSVRPSSIKSLKPNHSLLIIIKYKPTNSFSQNNKVQTLERK